MFLIVIYRFDFPFQVVNVNSMLSPDITRSGKYYIIDILYLGLEIICWYEECRVLDHYTTFFQTLDITGTET